MRTYLGITLAFAVGGYILWWQTYRDTSRNCRYDHPKMCVPYYQNPLKF
jgi:hypothetical protein